MQEHEDCTEGVELVFSVDCCLPGMDGTRRCKNCVGFHQLLSWREEDCLAHAAAETEPLLAALSKYRARPLVSTEG